MANVAQTVAVTGDIGLMIAINSMRDASARRIMRPAISQGMTIANRTAKKLVPRRTGQLKKAIKKRVGRARKGGVNASLFVSKKELLNQAYALEFGTRHIKKQSFLRRALGDEKQAIRKKIVTVARKRLKVEARKARAKGRNL